MRKRAFNRTIAMILVFCLMALILPAALATPVSALPVPDADAAALTEELAGAEGATDWMGIMGNIGTVGSAASGIYFGLNLFGVVKGKDDQEMAKLNQIIDTLSTMQKQLDKIEGELDDVAAGITGLSNAVTITGFNQVFSNVNAQINAARTLPDDYNNIVADFNDGIADGSIDPASGISNYDTNNPTFDPTSAGLGGDVYMIAAGGTTAGRQLLAFRLSGADASGEDYSGDDYVEFRVASDTSAEWTPVGQSAASPRKLSAYSAAPSGASYKYRIHLGHIQWTAVLENTVEGDWNTIAYGIVNYLNELNFAQLNLDTTPPFRPTVDAAKPYAYQSVSQVEALRGYFENEKHINKYTGKLETTSTQLVTSYGNTAGSLQTNIISFVNLISNNNVFSQTSGTTLFQYLDYYYTYLNMPYLDTKDSHGSYSARKQARDLLNLIVMEGLQIDNLYVHYMWMTNNYNHTSFITARNNISGAWDKIGDVNANDVFQLELASMKVHPGYPHYELFRGTIASVDLTDYTTGVKKTYMAVSSCTNSNYSTIVLPVIWDNQPITGVADNAFKDKMNITGVILPETVTFIGKDAFSGCTGLTALEIPDLTAAGMHPFSGIPCGVTYNGAKILDYLFAYANFSWFNVSPKTTEIGKGAFLGTYSLQTVNIPYSVTKIGDYAFCNSRVNTVNIYGNPTVGNYAFGYSFITGYDYKFEGTWGLAGNVLLGYNADIWDFFYLTLDDAILPLSSYFYNRDSAITSNAMDHDNGTHWRAFIFANSHIKVAVDDCYTYGGNPGDVFPANTNINCAVDATNVISYKDKTFSSDEFNWNVVYGQYLAFSSYRGTTSKPSVNIGNVAPPKAAYADSLKPVVVSTDINATESDAELLKLFDGKTDTIFSNDANQTIFYIKYNNPVHLRSYAFIAGGDASNGSERWTLFAVHDDKQSLTLYSDISRSDGGQFPQGAGSLAAYNLYANTTDDFKYYKFVINKSSGTFRLAELMLFDAAEFGDNGNTFEANGTLFAYTPHLSDFAPASGGNPAGEIIRPNYFPYVPLISPDGGNISRTQKISIENPNDEEFSVTESVYYTLDGSHVTTESTLYTAPFTLSESATVTAAVYDSVYRWSAPTSAIFTVTPSTGNGSGGSSRPAAPATPEYKADVAAGGGAGTSIPITVDKDKGIASVDIGSQGFAPGGTTITLPSIPDVGAYSVGIPVASLSDADKAATLTVKTDYGSVTIPSNMLAGLSGISGDKAEIAIGQGDKTSLPEDVKAAIGDRPLIQLTLYIDGKQTDWNNPNAPVTVGIPYSPTAEELANPESIVVWYIDKSGKATAIPNGRYDLATGVVTFTTTHFSDYAVAYNKVSFGDVAADAWYNKAVSFIAAREITGGTGGGNYSPEAKLTRGDFLVLMMRAYGIAPDENPTDNFSDAGSAYYTGYLAAAKRLGITTGMGGNMYAPGNEITREQMFTLLYNALKVIGQPLGNGLLGAVSITAYSDADDISDWARDAMTALVASRTITGNGGKLFPAAATTRAEMAQVLYNLLTGNRSQLTDDTATRAETAQSPNNLLTGNSLQLTDDTNTNVQYRMFAASEPQRYAIKNNVGSYYASELRILSVPFDLEGTAICKDFSFDNSKYPVLAGLLGEDFALRTSETKIPPNIYSAPPFDNMNIQLSGDTPAVREGQALFANNINYEPVDFVSSDMYTIGEIILAKGIDEEAVKKYLLPCNGQFLSAADNAPLYSLLDLKYGGYKKAFALPDLNSKPSPIEGAKYYICVLGVFPHRN